MLSKIKRLWPFRSSYNFLLSFGCVTAVAYLGMTIYTESLFSHPIVPESIKLMSRDSRIESIIGCPLTYGNSLKNKVKGDDKERFYCFKLNGPRGVSLVEMTAIALKAKEIFDPNDEKILKKQEIQEQIEKAQDDLSRVDLAMNRERSSYHKKSLAIQKARILTAIDLFREEYIKMEYEIKREREKFLTPDEKSYAQINNSNFPRANELLDDDQILWGLKDLVVTLPNKRKLVLIPEKKKTIEEMKIATQKPYPQRPTYAQVREALKVNLQGFTDAQIESYAQAKNLAMYSKYNSYRFITAVLFLGIALAAFRYDKNSLVMSISGTMIEKKVFEVVHKHPIVKELLENKIQKVVFEHLVEGGIQHNKFDCIFRIKGVSSTRVRAMGSYNHKFNEISFEKIVMEFEKATEAGKSRIEQTVNLIKV